MECKNNRRYKASRTLTPRAPNGKKLSSITRPISGSPTPLHGPDIANQYTRRCNHAKVAQRTEWRRGDNTCRRHSWQTWNRRGMWINVSVKNHRYLDDKHIAFICISRTRCHTQCISRLPEAVTAPEKIVFGNTLPIDGQARSESIDH